MIETKREKQEVIKGFLRWIEGEIGAETKAEAEAPISEIEVRTYYELAGVRRTFGHPEEQMKARRRSGQTHLPG